jgi:small subunit ribosomal protein S11
MVEKNDKTPDPVAPAAEAVPAKPVAADADAKSSSALDVVLGATGDEASKAVRVVRVKGQKAVPFGIAFINASFNNTMVTITDAKGGAIAWSTSGRAGFKGSRKSTAFAATGGGAGSRDGRRLGRGMQEVEVRVQGAGAGRESAIRALQSAGLNVTVIKDVTPMPHNGCRARKRRRV